MPRNFGTSFGFTVKETDETVDSFDELGLFRAQGVDVDNTICARNGQQCSTVVERDILDRPELISKIHHSLHVACVDNLNLQFTTQTLVVVPPG